MIKKLNPKLLNSTGDTIIEVMIVLAVLSLSIVISYATINLGLAQSRNAEEHSEALGLINSQVELVREDAQQLTPSQLSSSFCIPGNSSPNTIYSFGGNYLTTSITASKDSGSGYQKYGGCVSNGYHESVTYVCPTGKNCTTTPSAGYYDFLVRWDGSGSLGPQQAEITYRIYQLATSSSPNITLSASPPEIVVQVKKIPPNAVPSGNTGDGTTPSCNQAQSSDGAYTHGATINLTNNQPATTNSNGIASYQISDGSYDVGLNTSSLASGFSYCSPTSQSASIFPPNEQQTFTFYVVPQCTSTTTSTPTTIPVYGWVDYPYQVNVPGYWYDTGQGGYESSWQGSSTYSLPGWPAGYLYVNTGSSSYEKSGGIWVTTWYYEQYAWSPPYSYWADNWVWQQTGTEPGPPIVNTNWTCPS
jgi:type II secretory pathway pseudopilin PulG